MPSSYGVDAVPSADETTGLLEHQMLKPKPLPPASPSKRNGRAITAFLLALVCCACANSMALFSMFAPGFQHSLGFSLFQINSISIASALGMYLPVPLLGMIADRLGPGNLGIISIALFTPPYLIASYIAALPPAEAANYYHALAACFACIGTATSSLYFSGVITCAKMMPKSPGLAISAPVAAFGLSSLWQSQVLQALFQNEQGDLSLPLSFRFFAVLYLLTGTLAYLGSSVIGQLGCRTAAESELPLQQPEQVLSDDASQKLALIDHIEDTSYDSLANSEDDLIYKRHENVGQFLMDKTVWLMFGAFVLTSGPLEMFLNNMGMVINTVPDGPTVAANVSLFSAFSTLARLSSGVVSDLVQTKVSRPAILVFMLLVTALLNFLMATGVFTVLDHGRYFYLASSAIGFAYGSIYTLTPTIVACTWGVENLGTHWGIFITAPALGSTAYGSLFAKVYDMACQRIVTPQDMTVCTGLACYETTFLVTGSSLAIAAWVILVIYLFAWKPSRTLA